MFFDKFKRNWKISKKMLHHWILQESRSKIQQANIKTELNK